MRHPAARAHWPRRGEADRPRGLAEAPRHHLARSTRPPGPAGCEAPVTPAKPGRGSSDPVRPSSPRPGSDAMQDKPLRPGSGLQRNAPAVPPARAAPAASRTPRLLNSARTGPESRGRSSSPTVARGARHPAPRGGGRPAYHGVPRPGGPAHPGGWQARSHTDMGRGRGSAAAPSPGASTLANPARPRGRLSCPVSCCQESRGECMCLH